MTTGTSFKKVFQAPSRNQKVGATKPGRSKVPPNIPTVPIDKIFLYSVDCKHKWKFVVQRHISDEPVISDQRRSCKVVFYLFTVGSLLPTITEVSPFYPKLIHKFIVNLLADINDHGTPEFQKVNV